ncbi:hypothetical protein OGAPHI_006064 [Ogataea philodendri]|uniref:Uncharacterized protein n=1 Tax=Ogataea philodendri TaxID=1378263 RepID=A0A9P8NYL5_9ASCO|nr:uncharacterized protein OGAPHI_006064 [Ogataea philodendri]KAH3661885.1 hypothetical protein OGAPHI_006064 [Ogataea philodendri]
MTTRTKQTGTLAKKRGLFLSIDSVQTGSKHNDHRDDKVDRSNDECKHPLESDHLGEQLTESESQHQQTGTKTNRPIVVQNQDCQRNQQELPDENVCKNTCNQRLVVRVDQACSVPENSVHCP